MSGDDSFTKTPMRLPTAARIIEESEKLAKVLCFQKKSREHHYAKSPSKSTEVRAEASSTKAHMFSAEQLMSDCILEMDWDGNDVPSLKTAVAKLEAELRDVRNRCDFLERENQSLKQQLSGKANFFNEDQQHVIEKGTIRGYSWSNKTLSQALKLKFACSTKGYEELLHQGYPLPAKVTLWDRTRAFKFQPGILHEVFDVLACKVATMTDQEKICALTFDEMAIKASSDYDAQLQTFVGHVTLPGHEGPASKVLVFQLAGISTRWKQIVCYHFTSGSVDGRAIAPVISDIILEAAKIGLHVLTCTSDMGTSNLPAWN